MPNTIPDVSLILTYRCNAKCSMCNVWKNPSLPNEEVTLEVLDKLPYGFNVINLTGGEPTLRHDLPEIVDLLYPRAKVFEISSNGLLPEKIYPILQKYPNIKVRFSMEGFDETSDTIRGERGGYQKKIEGLRRLKEMGGTDLGFATTIQDENADQLVAMFEYAEKNCIEMSTSTVHNGFQFHKNDNVLYDRLRTAGYVEDLITAQLKTNNVKNWFRAYLNLGILARVLGHDRLLRCTAATDFAFVDPWGGVYACNVRPDLKIGDLTQQTWDEIVNSEATEEARRKVAACTQNCWMVGSAKTAMQIPQFPSLPRLAPLLWVIENKLRVTLGKKIDFNRYVDHSEVYKDPVVVRREPFSPDRPVTHTVQRKEADHYVQAGGYENR